MYRFYCEYNCRSHHYIPHGERKINRMSYRSTLAPKPSEEPLVVEGIHLAAPIPQLCEKEVEWDHDPDWYKGDIPF